MAIRFSVSCGNADGSYVTRGKAVRLGTSGDAAFDTPLKAGSFGMKDGCRVYELSRSRSSTTRFIR